MPGRKEVLLTQPALKDFGAIPKIFQNAIKEALGDLAHDAFLGKPLKPPFNDRRSYRLSDYRVTYRFDKTTITVISIQHRKDVYR